MLRLIECYLLLSLRRRRLMTPPASRKDFDSCSRLVEHMHVTTINGMLGSWRVGTDLQHIYEVCVELAGHDGPVLHVRGTWYEIVAAVDQPEVLLGDILLMGKPGAVRRWRRKCVWRFV
jgi:hypothetical protein